VHHIACRTVLRRFALGFNAQSTLNSNQGGDNQLVAKTALGAKEPRVDACLG
jgi:hypothetical protein